MLAGDGLTLVGDSFVLKENGPQVEFDVLANDLFDNDYTGARQVTSLSYGSEGGRLAISADGTRVLYTPPADFAGTESFAYSVDGAATAVVTVTIASPLASDQFDATPDGVQRVLDVLANDPFWPGYTGAGRITAVSVASGGGVVEIAEDGGSILYTPSTEPFKQETFTYVVDDRYAATVTVLGAETLAQDDFTLLRNAGPTVLDVLANDPFWSDQYAGERQITHVVGGNSQITISADGKSLLYTQPEGAFDAGQSMQSIRFQYVVDGLYEASVDLRVYNPVQNDEGTVDVGSSGYYVDLTSNDRYKPLGSNQYIDIVTEITSVTQPTSGGSVVIAPSGQGVYYTPAAGFVGEDTFTYVADGKYEATVTINVTLPVRDDLNMGVFQDTPDQVLNVLSNDFSGNGYTGARLITGVSGAQTGTVSIAPDGKRLIYTPAEGYTGEDSFTYMVDGEYEALVKLNVKPLAQGESVMFGPHLLAGGLTLDVLGNDYFGRGYTGPGLLTGVELVGGDGEVTITTDNRVLLTASAAGTFSIRYVVDGKYEATHTVRVVSFLSGDRVAVDQNSDANTLDVLKNDFSTFLSYGGWKARDYPGPRLITAVGPAQNGTVTIASDGKRVEYTPSADFYGTDSFTYTVDGVMVETVTVEVIRRVRDDQFRVDGDDSTQHLPVLVNDMLGADYTGGGQITHVSETTGGGTVAIGAGGQGLVYTPAEGFVGTDTFIYTVDGQFKAEVSVVVDVDAATQLPTFGNFDAYLQHLIDQAIAQYGSWFGSTSPQWYLPLSNFITLDGASAGATRDHSETNVQVNGVDEGDIVEFDSDYVYVLNDGEVIIVDAWPADALHEVSRVDIEGRTIAMFLDGDRLTVILQEYGYHPAYPYYPGTSLDIAGGTYDVGPSGMGSSVYFPSLPSKTFVTVIDVADRHAPQIVQKTEMEGRYVDSRAVGDFVYVLVENSLATLPPPELVDDDNDPLTPARYETQQEYVARVVSNSGEYVDAALPSYTSYDGDGELVRTGVLNTPENIYRPLVENARSLLSVVSFAAQSDEPGITDTAAVYGSGAQTVYASLDNFYVFDTDHAAEDGVVTRIMKFDWESTDGSIDLVASTAVAGQMLNQFSADENDGYLWITTTVSNSYAGNWSGRSENVLFVLQEDDGVFEFVGGLKNLALDESIRSVRFMGDRAFITTFRQVDPLFAIDLSDPTTPEAVGHLTIPGFTRYVHLVDHNYLLTVGKNTPGGGQGPTQVSIFDISDLHQPLRVAEYTFERFTFSEAEIDHHAFGYYATHGLLAMPVAKQRVERVDKDDDGYRETSQWIRESALAVFHVDASAASESERLGLLAELTHESTVRRSGFIGDKLYSIAAESIQVVDAADPATALASLAILPTPDPIEQPPGVELDVEIGLPILGSQVFVAPQGPLSPSPLQLATNAAREHLAAELGIAVEAALVVSVEATPHAPGGGFAVVLRVGDEHFLYRAADQTRVELVDGEFEFDSGTTAWHQVEVAAVAPPEALAGDYNGDERVDQLDYVAWKEQFGTWSLTSYVAADGNRDGVVDMADYTLWRNHLQGPASVVVPVVTGDYNSDGRVDAEDYTLWKSTFGQTVEPGTGADGNGDGTIDAADYTLWRNHAATPPEVPAAMQLAVEAAVVDEEDAAAEMAPLEARSAAFAELTHLPTVRRAVRHEGETPTATRQLVDRQLLLLDVPQQRVSEPTREGGEARRREGDSSSEERADDKDLVASIFSLIRRGMLRREH